MITGVPSSFQEGGTLCYFKPRQEAFHDRKTNFSSNADASVADNDTFKEMAKDVAMQIAAVNPTYVRREEVSEATLEKEKEIQLLIKLENLPI